MGSPEVNSIMNNFKMCMPQGEVTLFGVLGLVWFFLIVVRYLTMKIF